MRPVAVAARFVAAPLAWRRKAGTGEAMRFRIAALALLPLAMPLAAQEVPPTRDDAITAPLVLPTTPAPSPSPAPIPSPVPTPPPPVVSLPSPVRPSPTPRATAAAGAVARPSLSPTPTPRPTPTPSATPVARPTEVAPSAPLPEVTPAPAASPTPAVSPPATVPEEGGGAWWLVPLLLALVAAGWVMLRRSRADAAPDEPEDRLPAERPAKPAPVPAPPAAPSVTLRPLRIGLNMLTATFEGEILLSSEEAMEDVRVSLHLMAASKDEGQAIAALHDAPIGRTVVPAFGLAPGSARTVRGIGVLAREATGGLEAAGRPLFVPLVAVRLGWRDAGGVHHLIQAFAVGVERVDSPKLAPIWLDQPARSYEQIAARPHGRPMVRDAAIVGER
ncbi:hypothetical protein [Sphingomonas sp. S-NIH.Pt15_0812]|uniref:hypothetical protein n=1 Tax=Sphingomonas sp. S-NIH.Pt15_0812 TaxID=1920129 RepID=UPI000F7D86FC|nr:hypothetical protein [Sphingomonas sp. S-NIH.Pt15_0812]